MNSTRPERPDGGAPYETVGCVALVGLFLLCGLGPLMAATLGPVWLGMAAPNAAFVVWVKLGPAPMPGLVPGCLNIQVLLVCVGSLVIALVRLV